MIRACSVEGCGQPHEARGWCAKHYQRWKAHGDPLLVWVHHNAPPENATGADSLNWLGDNAGYAAVHKRLRLTFGKASTRTCPCGEPASDWSFDEPEGFSHDLSRYTARCRPCHLGLDRVSA